MADRICEIDHSGEVPLPPAVGQLPESQKSFARHACAGCAYRFTFEGKDIKVTVSIGVADLAPEMTEPLHFIKLADANLNNAKKAGRNRVVG